MNRAKARARTRVFSAPAAKLTIRYFELVDDREAGRQHVRELLLDALDQLEAETARCGSKHERIEPEPIF